MTIYFTSFVGFVPRVLAAGMVLALASCDTAPSRVSTTGLSAPHHAPPDEAQPLATQPSASEESARRLGIDVDPGSVAAKCVARLTRPSALYRKPSRRGDVLWNLTRGAVVEVLDPASALAGKGGQAAGLALVRSAGEEAWVQADALEPVPFEVDLTPRWEPLAAVYGSEAPPADCAAHSVLGDLDGDGVDEHVVFGADRLACRSVVAVYGMGARRGQLLAHIRASTISDVQILEFADRQFLAVEDQWVRQARWTGSNWQLLRMPEAGPGAMRPVFQTTRSAIDGRDTPVEYLQTYCEQAPLSGTREWGLNCRRTVRHVNRGIVDETTEQTYYAFDGERFAQAPAPADLAAPRMAPPIRISNRTDEAQPSQYE